MTMFPNFLTSGEITTLVNLSRSQTDIAEQHTSTVVNVEASESGSLRQSHTAFLDDDREMSNTLVRRILARVHSAAAVAGDNGESLQLTTYNVSNSHRYIPHMDSVIGVSRPATALLYLQTLRPGDGGSTVFVQTRLSARGARTLQAVRARQLEERGEISDEAFIQQHAKRLERSAQLSLERQKPLSASVDDDQVALLLEACRQDTAAAWAGRSMLLSARDSDSGAAAARGGGVAADSVAEGEPLLLRPVAGTLLLWRNHNDMGMLDWRTRHGACELEPLGEAGASPDAVRVPKLIAQRWLSWRRQRRRSQEGVSEAVEEDTLTETLRTCVNRRTAKAAGMDPDTKDAGFDVHVAERLWSFNQPTEAEL